MIGVVDRIEGNYLVIVLDNGCIIDIYNNNYSIKEGDVVILDSDGIHVDCEETMKRKEEVRKLMESVFED